MTHTRSFPVGNLDTILTLMLKRDLRSEWRWFVLPNGSFAVGFFPQGEGADLVHEEFVADDDATADLGGDQYHDANHEEPHPDGLPVCGYGSGERL